MKESTKYIDRVYLTYLNKCVKAQLILEASNWWGGLDDERRALTRKTRLDTIKKEGEK